MTEGPRVLLFNDDTDGIAASLRAACPDVPFETCNTYAALPAHLTSFQPDIVYAVRFDGTPRFPKDALFGPDGPRWIANGGVGVDHFGQWNPDKVTVTNTAGVSSDMMAEYVMGGFLHFTLDVPRLQSDKASKHWRSRTVRPLKGQTLLIVGLGHTGQAIAARAKAFGMVVMGTRARPRPMENVDEVLGSDALPNVLPKANFVAVSTPLIPTTRHILDTNAFGLMKPGVIIADVSRGGVIDQTALVRAMTSGKVAGAVLDVFETEPLPPDNPVWDMENAIISPHCSAVFEGWKDASFGPFIENLARWRAGIALTNVVDPRLGY